VQNTFTVWRSTPPPASWTRRAQARCSCPAPPATLPRALADWYSNHGVATASRACSGSTTSLQQHRPRASSVVEHLLGREGGLTVRVRQRALQKRRMSALFCTDRRASGRTCGGYGALYGAFRSKTPAEGARPPQLLPEILGPFVPADVRVRDATQLGSPALGGNYAGTSGSWSAVLSLRARADRQQVVSGRLARDRRRGGLRPGGRSLTKYSPSTSTAHRSIVPQSVPKICPPGLRAYNSSLEQRRLTSSSTSLVGRGSALQRQHGVEPR
jgi:hypothetical protein